jgi:ribosomal protein L37AE/L43A
MDYPKWCIRGEPTPNILYCCDNCQKATWSPDLGSIYYCAKCYKRYRKGTEKETEEAKKQLKMII